MASIDCIPEASVSIFWSNVRIRGADQCWIWRGYVAADGYGQFGTVGKKKFRAHRLAYMLSVGEIRHGSVVRHSCDRPLCCNPAHLSVGSHADNVRDRVMRKRSASAENGNWSGGRNPRNQKRGAPVGQPVPFKEFFDSWMKRKLQKESRA